MKVWITLLVDEMLGGVGETLGVWIVLGISGGKGFAKFVILWIEILGKCGGGVDKFFCWLFKGGQLEERKRNKLKNISYWLQDHGYSPASKGCRSTPNIF